MTSDRHLQEPSGKSMNTKHILGGASYPQTHQSSRFEKRTPLPSKHERRGGPCPSPSSLIDVFLLLAFHDSTGLFGDGERAAEPGPCPGSPYRSGVRSVWTGARTHLPREGRHPLMQNPAHTLSSSQFTHRKDLGVLRRVSVTQTRVHPHPRRHSATTHHLQGPPEKRAQ